LRHLTGRCLSPAASALCLGPDRNHLADSYNAHPLYHWRSDGRGAHGRTRLDRARRQIHRPLSRSYSNHPCFHLPGDVLVASRSTNRCATFAIRAHGNYAHRRPNRRTPPHGGLGPDRRGRGSVGRKVRLAAWGSAREGIGSMALSLFNAPTEPMDLANMSANGVHSLDVQLPIVDSRKLRRCPLR
jgi:hypothetical protein